MTPRSQEKLRSSRAPPGAPAGPSPSNWPEPAPSCMRPAAAAGRRPVRDRPARDHRGDRRPDPRRGRGGTAPWSIMRIPARSPRWWRTIERDQGRLDVLVNDIFGGDRYSEWDKPLWEHDWAGGLRMLQMGVHTHLITCRAAIPLMLRTAAAHGTHGLVVEMTDGTSQANAEFRRNVGFYYDLVKANVERIVNGLTPSWTTTRSRRSASRRAGCARRRCWTTSGSPRTPGAMPAQDARFRDLRVADLCRQGRCRARPGSRRRAAGRHDHQRPPARRRLRRHRHRREQARLLGLPGRLRLGAPRRRRHRRLPVANVAYPAAVSSGSRGTCIGEDERGSPARPGVPRQQDRPGTKVTRQSGGRSSAAQNRLFGATSAAPPNGQDQRPNGGSARVLLELLDH